MSIGMVLPLVMAAFAQGPAPRSAAAWPCISQQRQGESSRLRLLPVDQATTQPDFFSFRARLQAAIARRDEPALLAAVDPGIRTSFGSDAGMDAFKARLRDPNSTLWADLATTLALGGAFRSLTSFEAPYVFATWPEDVDSFQCTAVVGDLVRVRATAQPDSAVVTSVSFDVLQLLPGPGSGSAVHVRLWNGRMGYIAASFLRSPVEHRAIFQRAAGQWRLAAFVAGD